MSSPYFLSSFILNFVYGMILLHDVSQFQFLGLRARRGARRHATTLKDSVPCHHCLGPNSCWDGFVDYVCFFLCFVLFCFGWLVGWFVCYYYFYYRYYYPTDDDDYSYYYYYYYYYCYCKKHGLPKEKSTGKGLRQPSQKTWVTVAKNTTEAENTPNRWLLLLLLLLLRLLLLLLLLLLLPHRSKNRRKKHDFLRPSASGGGLRQPSQKTWVTVAKNTTDAENTPYRCKKHGQPSQKTCPPTRTVAKNTRHRCKKHLPREPSQKTRKLATVAKNMSYRRKKHATRIS